MGFPGRRSWLRIAALVAIAVCGASCLSPTLPLPPPDQPDFIQASEVSGTQVSGSGEETWMVAGVCTPGALVVIVNRRTNTGGSAEDLDGNGRYQVEIEARQCDTAELFEQLDGEVSTGTKFVIEPTVSGKPESSACY